MSAVRCSAAGDAPSRREMFRLVYRTPPLLSFAVGSSLDLGIFHVRVLVVGSSRLAIVVAVLAVLVDY